MINFFSRFYLHSELSSEVVALYSNRTIQRIATGLLGLFLPIFLFQKYQSINLVLFYYLAGYIIYLFFITPGAIIASKITFKKSLIISVFGGILYYICFYLFDYGILLFSILSLIFVTFDRVFYWVPYHSGFAKFTDKKNRGRVIALFGSITSLLGIASPLIAGFIIAQYGFNTLFLIVILIYGSSVVPFFSMTPIREYYTFGYWQTWKILFHPRDRRILFTYMADGAQDFIGMAIWPIFIWQLLNNSYTAMGIISSLIVLVTILLRLAMGKYTDQFNKKRLLKYGTVLFSIGWILKAFIQTGFHIFIVSSYHNFSAIAMRTPYDTLMYEKVADAGHYMDEYTVLRSMALNIGRIAMILILFVLFNFFGLHYAFIFAALAALFINFI